MASKHWITGAGVSRLHLIFARTFDERGEELGIGGFLAVRDESKGLRVGRREQTMGLRGMPEGEIIFEDLEVPTTMAVLPPSGFRRGFADLMNAYNSQRVGAGTVAMGIAAGALDHALDWAKTREQFGRPIGEFQGLQWMLADMEVQLSAARLMLYQAARSRGPDNSAFPGSNARGAGKDFSRLKPPSRIVNDALQIFGARGYSRELPLERMARDVRMFTIGGGTAQVLRTLGRFQDARMEIAADTRWLHAKAFDARRRGVIMHAVFASAGKTQAIPIWFVHAGNFDSICKDIDEQGRMFVAASGFEPKAGRLMLLPAANGTLAGILFGIEAPSETEIDRFRPGQLSGLLPAGNYRFANAPHDARLAALAFALGTYQFVRYRKKEIRNVRLEVPDGVDGDDLTRIVEGVTLCRDLTNTPSNDMGPSELEAASRALARQHGGKLQVTSGEALAKNFPLVHAVGAGSARAPRLIDMTWGKTGDPKITLVGKGVCFDTGGLDIKPDTGMLNMKKDMGGAATALALAHMIMARDLKVRLRVIIPAVENSISGTSFRPRDVFVSRKGISVEIGNTDAEGRLILADALALADEDEPALMIDFATLTGAARVALGPEVAPFFTDDDTLADELARAGVAENDPLWRMPLWRPYEAMLDSKVADLNNVATGGHGGAITAALFLRRFVATKSWLHFDIFAWTPTAKPGRPEGAECQVARALYALLWAAIPDTWLHSIPA